MLERSAAGTGSPRRRRPVRHRWVLAPLVLLVGAAAAACGPVADPPPGCPAGPPDGFTSTVVNRVNADRGAAGLGALAWDARLACLAGDTSNRMVASGQLTHSDLGATIRSPGFAGYAALGENVVVGTGTMGGDAAHDVWMASSPHRANVLGAFHAIGVAWARGDDGRLWAAEEFGRYG